MTPYHLCHSLLVTSNQKSCLHSWGDNYTKTGQQKSSDNSANHIYGPKCKMFTISVIAISLLGLYPKEINGLPILTQAFSSFFCLKTWKYRSNLYVHKYEISYMIYDISIWDIIYHIENTSDQIYLNKKESYNVLRGKGRLKIKSVYTYRYIYIYT